MPRLVESLSRFFGRVEILARGVENERRAAEMALARGKTLEARENAREIVARLPESPLGLALWADAAEDAWLDHEVVAALSELAKQMPWRADVWLRLGRAGRRIDWAGARDALERAAAAPEERSCAREALFDLCDLDLAAGDPARAQRWLDRVPAPLGGGPDREVLVRRAEASLGRGDFETAGAAAAKMGEDSPVDDRAASVRARLALHAGETMRALDLALRAFVLDGPGAGELLAAVVAASRDVVLVDRVRRVVAAAGLYDEPQWAAAFAFAEGRREDARRALARGLEAGDRRAASALLRLALETRDLEALHAVAARDPEVVPADLRTLREAALLHARGEDASALDRLDEVGSDAAGWAGDLRREIVRAWVPAPPGDGAAPTSAPDAVAHASGADLAPAAWPSVLRELRVAARALDRLDLVGPIEALAVERERPLRVAVVGEFNAGKSTFLNALLGVDVAPTGVLPTTATLHWVAWAPDPFARVVVRASQDRVVPHADLKATLRSLHDSGAKVERVFIYAPIERLKRIEVLDTPGFNAPDPDHVAAARQAFDEAHVAIWLLDATQPIKETERRVLDEIKALGVPVQILANKADRLDAAARVRVLEHIREGLESAGIRSHAPPIAFSARLSLAGRLGDAAALAASGWSDVEALLSERIVDASEGLRERALRRKATRLAGELATLASARAAEERAAARAARDRDEALLAGAARLSRDRPTLAVTVDRSIEVPRRHLAGDLRPLAALSDGASVQERAASGPALAGIRAYTQERFVARLGEPIVTEIAGAAGVDPPARAAAAVRAVLAGAVAAQEAPAALADRSLAGVVEAAIDAFASALVAVAAEPEPPQRSAAIEQRIESLREALRGA